MRILRNPPKHFAMAVTILMGFAVAATTILITLAMLVLWAAHNA